MTAVEFEPTQLALVELESTPLDHSGKVSLESALPMGVGALSRTHANTHTYPGQSQPVSPSVRRLCISRTVCLIPAVAEKKSGLLRELNPGPLAP